VPAAAVTPAAGSGRQPAARATPPGATEAATLPPRERGSDTRSNADPQSGPSIADAPAGGADRTELTNFLAPAQGPGELGRLGSYRILRVLGAGGMGVVYQAEDPNLKRLVALKAMLPSLASSASARQRFLREAQSAAAIDHDHIVHIYQVDEDRGVPFLAMQFLRGEPLDARLTREPKLALAEVLRIGRETAAGLAAAHKQGLIHRDIKPANLWLEADTGRVKILDFGLARAAADDAHLTQQGAIMGTPAFMAPEQAAGQAVDARCDLFSLGCVLYRLCTGLPAFDGTDMIATLMAVATHHPKPPCVVDPRVPVALSGLIVRLLAKKPEERPASALAVVEALRALETEPTLVVPPQPRPAPLRKKGKKSKTGARRRRGLGLVFGLAALGLVLVAGGAYLAFRGGGEPTGDRPPEAEPVVHLFNGTDLGNFYTYLRNPRGSTIPYLKDNDPEKVFTVQDGLIRVSGQVFGCLSTREEYANYRLVLEYKWGDKTWPPRAPKARDSGVFLHCVGADGARAGVWPESIRCQLIEGGAGNLWAIAAAGSPYFSPDPEQQGTAPREKPAATPPTNELYHLDWNGRDKQWKDVKGFRGADDVEKPAGEWNRLECICNGDSLTVFLNGQQVNAARNLSLTRGRIALQSAGAEVFFRTIDIQPLPGFHKALPPEEKPWQTLFNGKDLAGWTVQDGKLDNWTALNGVLTTQGKDKGWLMTEKEYTDYEVRLEYRMVLRTNSGVALRTPLAQNPVTKGLEIQIIDDAHEPNLKPDQASGALFGIIPSIRPLTRPPAEWNHMRIALQGQHLIVDLNGHRVLDADLDNYKQFSQKHPGLLQNKGRIGLQSYANRCEFREIFVRPLPPSIK